MPNRDGTGPEGKGLKTGRQMGKCEGAKPMGRRFRPCGCGRRGHRRRFANCPSDKEE